MIKFLSPFSIIGALKHFENSVDMMRMSMVSPSYREQVKIFKKYPTTNTITITIITITIITIITITSSIMISVRTELLSRRKLESWRGRRRALAFSTGCIDQLFSLTNDFHHIYINFIFSRDAGLHCSGGLPANRL